MIPLARDCTFTCTIDTFESVTYALPRLRFDRCLDPLENVGNVTDLGTLPVPSLSVNAHSKPVL